MEGDGLPDLSSLPAQFLDRLKGPDGQLDPVRVKEFKDRICSLPAPPGRAAEGKVAKARAAARVAKAVRAAR